MKVVSILTGECTKLFNNLQHSMKPFVPQIVSGCVDSVFNRLLREEQVDIVK